MTPPVPPQHDSSNDPEQGEEAQPKPKPVILMPITGPAAPDMTRRVEESRRRHEAELAASQKLVEQARGGWSPAPGEPASSRRVESPLPPPLPGTFRVEIDWRGETADYVENDRRVSLSCSYWGGVTGHVSFGSAFWQFADTRRERLTPDERTRVLQRVIEHARSHHDIKLTVEGE